jgi:hypothetical protein
MTHEEKIKELVEGILEGKQMQRLHEDKNWIDCQGLFMTKDIDTSLWRIKPPLTREEITAQWVKDNDVKVGDKVRVLGWHKKYAGMEGIVKCILDNCLDVEVPKVALFNIAVEDIIKLKSSYQKFTFEDREEFRGKWVRWKDSKDEYLIVSISENGVIVLGTSGVCSYSYETMSDNTELINGKPFGKEIWE